MKQTVLLSGRNADTVTPNTALAKSFDIKNTIGLDLEVHGMLIKYKAGLQRIHIDFKNRKAGNEMNIAPTEEGVLLSAIGSPFTSELVQVLRIKPFTLRNDTAIDVRLATPNGETVNPKDVDITLLCSPGLPESKTRTALIPFRNTDQINPGIRKRFELRNPVSREMRIVGIISRHRANLEQVTMRIETKAAGSQHDLTPGASSVALGALGVSYDSPLMQMFRIQPLRLTASGVISLDVDNATAETVFVGDMDLTLVCEYEEK